MQKNRTQPHIYQCSLKLSHTMLSSRLIGSSCLFQSHQPSIMLQCIRNIH